MSLYPAQPDIDGLAPEDAALLERRRRALGPAYRLFYEHPLHIVRGEGVWLIDREGRRYLDAYNNVASVGHSHPHVVEALRRQAGILNTHTRYLSEPIVAYAERLLSWMPDAIGHVMFCCTGSEANDLALRIARAVTGAEGLIVTANAYHGVTSTVAEGSPSLGPDNPVGETVWTVPAPHGAGGDVAADFTAGVAAALADMEAKGVRPAALLVDTLFSSDGVYADPPGFLALAVAAVRAAGGLFIADEVQAGFARTGPSIWGFARHGLEPDIVTMGKPMGNGHPLAGVAARPDLIAEFGRKVRYFNTFGGNPVSAAVGMAVLDVIETEGLAANAKAVGGRLAQGISALSQNHPLVGEVRSAGLFLGVELGAPDAAGATAASRIVNHMREHGVLLSATGPAGNILKIRPPLILKPAEADLIVETLDGALRALG